MMTKYEEGYLYRGDLYRIDDNKKILINSNVPILYNEALDTFYLFNSSASRYYYSLIMDSDKLSKKDTLEYEKIFLAGNYPYKSIGNEGEIFIDIKSIILDDFERKNRK